MDWKYLFTSLGGRINRKPYWLATLVLIVVSIVLQLVLLSLFGPIVTFVVSLPVLFAAFALSIKRAHDRNRPDWYVIGFYVLCIVFQLATFMIDPVQAGTPLTIGSGVLLVWALILLVDLGFLRGTEGPNQYGPDPLAT